MSTKKIAKGKQLEEYFDFVHSEPAIYHFTLSKSPELNN